MEGNYEEAILSFTAAIEIDPKKPLAFIGRGDAYVGSGEMIDRNDEWNKALTFYRDAEKDYLVAVSLEEINVDVYHKLADVYLVIGETDKAISILNKGYDITGDKTLKDRADSLGDLPSDLPVGSMVVSMYNVDYGFAGHDAYTFDRKGRMTSNIWYDADNSIMCTEVWKYDDQKGITNHEYKGWVYDESTDTDEYVETSDKINGCDDMGWYWYDMDEFLTDPSLEETNGKIDMEDGKYAIYGYNASERVSTIHTYDAGGELLGYCIVSYVN